jgi:photosystem II stability/assembly factor-like uncharacterized protein
LGKTWTTLGNFNRFIFGIAPGKAGLIYLYEQRNGKLRKSTDFGANWAVVGTAPIPEAKVLVVSPDNPDKLWLGSNGIYVSKDGGLTWEERSRGLGNIAFTLRSDPHDAGTLYLEYSTIPNHNCILFRSQDGGKTWQEISTSEGACYLSFSADGTKLYSSSSRLNSFGWTGAAYVSTDEGTTWHTAFQLPQGADTCIPDPLNNEKFFAFSEYTYSTSVWISENGGVSWTSNALPDGNWSPGFYTIDGKQVYFLELGISFYSSDGGISWAPCGDVTGQISGDQKVAINPQDPSELLAGTWGSGILRSTDGCLSWIEVNRGLTSKFINSIAYDPNNPKIAYAGTDGGLFISFDGGLTWNPINDGLLGALVIYSITVDKQSNVFAATPYGIFQLQAR